MPEEVQIFNFLCGGGARPSKLKGSPVTLQAMRLTRKITSTVVTMILAGQAIQHRRIVDEMNLSLINLIDQMIDAIGVVFYMLFWAGSNGWIQVNIHLFMSLYDASWELR